MRWRLRYQILVPWLLLLLGVVGITTWNAVSSARRVRRQLEQQVREAIHSLNRVPENYPLYDEKILELAQGLSGAEILVIDQEGKRHSTLSRPPARLSQTELEAVQLPEPELDAEEWQSLRLEETVVAGKKRYFSGGVRITRSRRSGTRLYVLYPESLWRDAEWAAVQPSLILGGFAGLASLVLAIAVGERMSRRIQQLERRTRQIAEGDFSPMPLPGRNDELRDLGVSVNEMAEKLAMLQQTVRNTERLRLLGQVSGGLAHQLRNSATGARLAVQLQLRECAGRVDTEALEVALRQLTLLEANLKRFLDLGRTGSLRLEHCSIVALLDDAVNLLHPQCRHTRVDLRWEPPAEDIHLRADGGQLMQVFINLLDNALAAAGPGGWVAVSIHRETASPPLTKGGPSVSPPLTKGGPGGVTCIIEIRDSGPGPPPQVVPRLFEPFVTSKSEGVGLGLAVSRQIAEAHGGQLTWSRQDDTTVFRLSIPLLNGDDEEERD